MTMLMFALLALGLALLFGAPWVARLFTRGRDPVALTRILQAAALVIIVLALLIGPQSPENTAFPPPPDGPPIGGN